MCYNRSVVRAPSSLLQILLSKDTTITIQPNWIQFRRESRFSGYLYHLDISLLPSESNQAKASNMSISSGRVFDGIKPGESSSCLSSMGDCISIVRSTFNDFCFCRLRADNFLLGHRSKLIHESMTSRW